MIDVSVRTKANESIFDEYDDGDNLRFLIKVEKFQAARMLLLLLLLLRMLHVLLPVLLLPVQRQQLLVFCAPKICVK